MVKTAGLELARIRAGLPILAFVAAAMVLQPAYASKRPLPAGACGAAPSPATVAGFSPHGDLLLTSGTIVRLAQVRAADGDHGAAARRLLEGLIGREVAVALRPDGPDRWGRHLADVFAPAPLGDVAQALVAAGLAMVDTGLERSLCRPALLKVETAARAARAGMWRDERPVAASDVARLDARAGTFTLVEGRVLRVGERRARTYLDFARFGTGGFTVVLPTRAWTALKALGHDAASLRGRRIRVRGIIERRRGPTIEVVAADAIEILEPRRLRP